MTTTDFTPLLEGIFRFVSGHGGHWSGSSTELLEALQTISDGPLPLTPSHLSAALREAEQALADLGIEIAFERSRDRSRRRIVRLESAASRATLPPAPEPPAVTNPIAVAPAQTVPDPFRPRVNNVQHQPSPPPTRVSALPDPHPHSSVLRQMRR